MSKNKMQLKYKSKKRERNKNKKEETSEIKSFLINLGAVLLFIGLIYLSVLGLKSLGLFYEGYTKPTKESTEISYEYILVGTVFDRNEKDYYVMFDDYEKNINTNVNKLVADNSKLPVYKVDLSKKENSSVISDTFNKNAKSVDELKINDITLIRITNGKISNYVVGNDDIEVLFSK